MVEPIFESKTDHEIMYLFAKKFGICGSDVQEHQGQWRTEPLVEDITREFNRGMWTIGYTGQSPERLRKAHGQPAHLRQDHAPARWVVRPMVSTTGCRGRAGERPEMGIRAPPPL